MKKFLQVIFDFLVIYVLRAVICFLASATQGADLSGSEMIWITSIICGLIFAEFFEVRRKDND